MALTGVMTEALKSLIATDRSLSSETLDEGKVVFKFIAVWIWLVQVIFDETLWRLGTLIWH